MNKIEEMITESRLYEMLRKREQDKVKKTILCILAIVGAVIAVAGIAYAVYRYFNAEVEEEMEDEFDEDFDDDFFEDEGATE